MDEKFAYEQDISQNYGSNLSKASLARRIIAYIIDSIILLVLLTIILMILIFAGVFVMPQLTVGISRFRRPESLMALSLVYGLELIYFTYFESRKSSGATPGKRLVSIKVMNRYGDLASLEKSFLRNLLRLIWFIPCIGLIILIIDIVLIADKDQRIGDTLAGTYVIKKEERLEKEIQEPASTEYMKYT